MSLELTGATFFGGTSGPDLIQGKGGDDTIYGGYGDDVLQGDDGDDVFLLNGSEGNDFYEGGSGSDSIFLKGVSYVWNYVEIGISSMTSIEAIINLTSVPTTIKTKFVT
ncbi:hypothetical protein QA634_32870 [Methylobacterium sp. CB376]|uniref:hypothetical protein n=1 Tax=unclassified Methylobacterium TaxID=2615210 RepID=UPI000152C5D2|nr:MULTISPECIES: hypothetical protein [Methylobacterium]WFT79924.1 hypothetical protein QA634_32870 [Methylobacterium nodulans]